MSSIKDQRRSIPVPGNGNIHDTVWGFVQHPPIIVHDSYLDLLFPTEHKLKITSLRGDKSEWLANTGSIRAWYYAGEWTSLTAITWDSLALVSHYSPVVQWFIHQSPIKKNKTNYIDLCLINRPFSLRYCHQWRSHKIFLKIERLHFWEIYIIGPTNNNDCSLKNVL